MKPKDPNSMTVVPSTLSWMAADLDEWEELQRFRRRVTIEHRSAGRITVDGREYVDVSSNDYLGLANHPEVAQAAIESIKRAGWGAGASPLVIGHRTEHAELERRLAEFEGAERAVLFPSGYAANVGMISALVGPGDLILSDRRNHASIIDGCRLSRATIEVFDGPEPDQLVDKLGGAGSYGRKLLVTDGVFSMDGDVARLDRLCEIAQQHGCMVYVDEAHGTGVLGDSGRGACQQMGVERQVDIRMGTLSKALGGIGGFVVGEINLIEWIINRVRPVIFSTGLPPGAAAASRAAIEIVEREPERRRRVNLLAERLRTGLAARGISTGGSQSPIVPVIVGSDERALTLADLLREAGFWSVAIRPPTVPVGSSRVRLSLTASHTSDQVDRLIEVVGSAWAALGAG